MKRFGPFTCPTCDAPGAAPVQLPRPVPCVARPAAPVEVVVTKTYAFDPNFKSKARMFSFQRGYYEDVVRQEEKQRQDEERLRQAAERRGAIEGYDLYPLCFEGMAEFEAYVDERESQLLAELAALEARAEAKRRFESGRYAYNRISLPSQLTDYVTSVILLPREDQGQRRLIAKIKSAKKRATAMMLIAAYADDPHEHQRVRDTFGYNDWESNCDLDYYFELLDRKSRPGYCYLPLFHKREQERIAKILGAFPSLTSVANMIHRSAEPEDHLRYSLEGLIEDSKGTLHLTRNYVGQSLREWRSAIVARAAQFPWQTSVVIGDEDDLFRPNRHEPTLRECFRRGLNPLRRCPHGEKMFSDFEKYNCYSCRVEFASEIAELEKEMREEREAMWKEMEKQKEEKIREIEEGYRTVTSHRRSGKKRNRNKYDPWGSPPDEVVKWGSE